jgi:hypothetical protein
VICSDSVRFLTAALTRPSASDPSHSPLLRSVAEHSARARHQIRCIARCRSSHEHQAVRRQPAVRNHRI